MEHKVSQHKLVGGAQLLAVQIPNTITYYWGSFFRAGYRFVDPGKYELPHLAEHLAFAGTKQYPDDVAFKVAIERGGTIFNASTSQDAVSYYFVGSRDELNHIIPLNMSQIYEPLFEPKRIDQEKAVITQEMSRKKEEDNWRLGYAIGREMFPVINREIEQRIADIKSISRQDLIDYHANNYGASNTIFVLAGDYDDSEIDGIKTTVNKFLGNHQPGHQQPYSPLKPGKFGGKILALKPVRPQQSTFQLHFIRPGRDDESYPALKVLDVLCTGGLSARMGRMAREAGLTYGLHTAASSDQDATEFIVYSQTSADKLEPLLELAIKELARVGNGDFSDDDLDHAKGIIVGSVRRGRQTPPQFAGWYVRDALRGWELESPERWVERIESITREDILNVYRRYIKRENSLLGMVGAGLEDKSAEFDALLNKYFA